MTQLILNVRRRSKLPFLKEVLSEMSFAKVIEPTKKNLTARAKPFLADIEESVEFIKNYNKEKEKAKSTNELLDEL